MLFKSRKNLDKILVIYLGNWQERILTHPAFKKLRRLLPDAKITLMVAPQTKQLVTQIFGVDDVLVYEGAGDEFRNAEDELAFISKLRQYTFDASVIFTNFGESPYPLAYICYLAEIPIRIGYSQEFGGGVLSQRVNM